MNFRIGRACEQYAPAQPAAWKPVTSNWRLFFFALLSLHAIPQVAQAADSNEAVNDPDRFNWALFVQVNAPSGGGKNRLWETWADNATTFPQTPSRTSKPVFPTQAPTRSLEVLNQQILRAAILKLPGFRISTDGSEEVRRNQASFDFIVTSDLYFREGIAAAVKGQKPPSFPSDAVELKAVWKPMSAVPTDRRQRYYVNRTADGKEFGLVGLHIMSKAVSNWTWATFEHSDNPGRCDYIGCHDAFGAQKADVKANDATEKGYPECTHSPSLQKMFDDAGLKEGFWSFYCLKGSQTDFADQSAWGTRLGNSVTEAGFVDTSSCMSCHARSAFDGTMASKFSGGFNTDGSGPIGYPDASTFFKLKAPAKFTQPRPAYQYLPMDFIWSFLRANSVGR